MTIKLILSYDIVYKYPELVEYLWLNEYGLNEGLVDWNDTCEIDISSDQLRILNLIMDYLD